jgi:chemotaxis-related protein WspB
MLMLLFYAGDDLYAIESTHVVEVIPRVALRKVQYVPEYVAGLFNYRGTILPVVDLCHLIQGNPSHAYLSTRIMIVSHTKADGELQYLGLMAERVTETLNRSLSDIRASSIHVDGAPYLTSTIIDEKRIIQCLQIEQLFNDDRHHNLLTGEANLPR